jgi:glyoxylase-like metal-dependent hydrolase (beta-lactamase superfamily II)
MYGVVPKLVWQRVTPPDDQNRIPFAIHCVLAQNDQYNVLIETGHGDKLAPLDRAAHSLEPGNPLLDSLARLGLGPADIDMVVMTHLHWDHAGGATTFDEQRHVRPTFPNATYYVNQLEWEDANSGAPELTGSYELDNFVPLAESGQLVLVNDGQQIVSGLTTRVTGGHTRGHQALLLESDGQTAIYLGDLCPVTTHLRRMWGVAYDLYPMEIRQRKPQILGEAADQNWWILWDHDSEIAVSRIARHEKREFVVQDARAEL